jgi:hypothetical protein
MEPLPDEEIEEKGPVKRTILFIAGPLRKYMVLRFALAGSVGLILSGLLFFEGISQGFNAALWTFIAIFFTISATLALLSWRWLFVHRKPKGERELPPSSG